MAKGKKYKTTSNDIQNTTQKTKDRVRQSPLQPRVDKGNNKITELRTIVQRKSPNS
jgi:hypothetical protein